MLTVLVATALAFGLTLLPAILLVVGVVFVGAVVGTMVMAALSSLPSIAAFILIGWAIYKGATRRSAAI